MSLETTLKQFLHKYLDREQELLLALSGGPDSLALFHLLLRYRERYPFQLRVAHVDHGWRKVSADEAMQLKTMVLKEKIPFHLRTLSPEQVVGNLEDCCRELRHQFLREIVDAHHCQAVMLGHHSDDQGETVLKRLFEGTSLVAASGMAEVTTIGGLTLWRPLLGVSRKVIARWIDKHHLNPFHDDTNNDSRFLRGRMRNTLIPTLAEQFGKEITSSLCRIGKQAQELREHLDQQIMPFLALLEEGVHGTMLDLSLSCPQSSLVWKHLVRTVAGQCGLCLSEPTLETVVQLLERGAADRKACVADCMLQVDRKRLFLCKKLPEEDNEPENLDNKHCRWGSWDVIVERWKGDEKIKKSGWKDVWRGCCSVIMPEGEYCLETPHNQDRYQQTTLDRFWTQHQVPAFLRRSVPIIKDRSGVQHEFLSGRVSANDDTGSLKITIRMSR